MAFLIEDYYEKEQCFDYFILIDEEPLLLQYISLIELTKEFDKVALISVTADDIMHFACFKKYIIVNLFFYEKFNRNIYVNKLIQNETEQRSEIFD